MCGHILGWEVCELTLPQTGVCASTFWAQHFSKALKPDSGGPYSGIPHFQKPWNPECVRAYSGLGGVVSYTSLIPEYKGDPCKNQIRDFEFDRPWHFPLEEAALTKKSKFARTGFS